MTMPIAFLFPASDLHPKKVNEAFADQWESLRPLHPCALYRDGKIVGSVADHRVVYRGWMLSVSEYLQMTSAIYAAGGMRFTSLGNYMLCHSLPEWYPYIEDLTMKTVFFQTDCDIENEHRKLNWPGYFIKDHVKSNKSSLGSVAMRPEDAPDIVAELVKYRGKIEGGLCVRELMPVTEEHRVFVRDGEFYVRLPIPRDYLDLVMQVRKRILAPFYSIDLGINRYGKAIVVEIGDGQVSDIVGWTPESFTKIWKD